MAYEVVILCHLHMPLYWHYKIFCVNGKYGIQV